MAKRLGLGSIEKLEAERAAARIANLAHLSGAELTVRALRWDEDQAIGGRSWGTVGANMYREEVQRRQRVAA